MNRKPTKNTRGPNAEEKRFQCWVKEQGCWYCPQPGPSIVDHARGATYKHNKVLIGHWFVTAKCYSCDFFKTNGNHHDHYAATGQTEAEAWLNHVKDSPFQPPTEVVESIRDWGR